MKTLVKIESSELKDAPSHVFCTKYLDTLMLHLTALQFWLPGGRASPVNMAV